MTPEEAKAHLAAQKEKLRGLQSDVERLAAAHSGPVLFAMLRALVEMVCTAQGPNFTLHNKSRFYAGVLLMLREKGIA